MRRPLFALTVAVAAAAACAACSSSESTSAESTAAPSSAGQTSAAPQTAGQGGTPALKVQATYGTEQFPMAAATAEIAACDGGAKLATITTGKDGAAVYNGAPGCYRIQVSAPIGCSPDGDATQQVTSAPGDVPAVTFRFRCA